MDEIKHEALIPRKTLTQLVNAWDDSCKEIRTAFGLLVTAEKRLKETFKPESYLFSLTRNENRHCRNYNDPEGLIKEIKKDAWRALIDRMDLKRLLSLKRSAELEKQLETGEGLPEIEESQILGMLEGTATQLEDFMQEAVKEIFEWLRPHNDHYKTNTQFELGKKVILGWIVEATNYGTKKFHVHYGSSQDRLRVLDNVFHMLDGNGQSKTYRGELVDAIEASGSKGVGETTYFKFKCYINRNLHLEFKRLDLVAKLNQVAGGAKLKGTRQRDESQVGKPPKPPQEEIMRQQEEKQAKQTVIDTEVLAVLKAATFGSDTIKLNTQLGRDMYVKVNKVIESAGGIWNRGKQVHMFKQDPKEVIDLEAGRIVPAGMTGEGIKQAVENGAQKTVAPGLYPTPPDLARRMVQNIGVDAGQRILEPSAGTGNLVKAIFNATTGPDCCRVVAIESNPILAEELRLDRSKRLNANDQNYEIRCADFLECVDEKGFDRIVMNPPFENRQDIAHVLHAYSLLKPGGSLIAVMGAAVRFDQKANSCTLRRIIERNGGSIEDLPEDTFKVSGTGVNTVLVVLDKPKEVADVLADFNAEAAEAQQNAKDERANEIVGELGLRAAGTPSLGSVEGSPLFSTQGSLF